MKQIVTKGIILRRTNFGEADRIITVLTVDQGKIRLVAKGVRRIKSKLAGGIELLSLNDITYAPGKGDLGTLISARVVTNFGNIVTDVERMMYTYDVLKLIDKATEDSADQDYYITLVYALDAINELTVSLDWIRLWFILRLLRMGGHEPNLTTTSQGSPLQATDVFTFSFDDMTFEPHTAGVFGAKSIKLLRLAIEARSPRQLAQISNSDNLLPPLVQLTRTMLAEHAHYA